MAEYQCFTAEPEADTCSAIVREAAWHLGDVIRKLRAAADLTLHELADQSGVNISVIHDLEIGRTKEAKRATLDKLASAFSLTARELEDLIPSQPVRFDIVTKVKETRTLSTAHGPEFQRARKR